MNMNLDHELNLSLTPGVAGRLAKHSLLSEAAPTRQRVVSTYFDTPDQRLRRERVVVGYRKSGSEWLSSVRRCGRPLHRQAKTAEWEAASEPGELDFSHVEDESLRAWLESLRDELQPAFTTSFTRSAWLLEPRDGVRIELSLDRGWIEAAGRRQPICEVELDLVAGGVADLFSTAGKLQTELRLHPEAANMIQRGYQACVDAPRQAVKALPIATDGRMSTISGFRTIALACLRHLQSNEQGVRESDSPEFVHQARVAIRRLRSAIRVWKPLLPADFVADFDPLWQALAARLGDTRNWDVFNSETLPTIIDRFPASPEVARLADYAQRRCAMHRQAARQALSSLDYSRLLLDFPARLLDLPEDTEQRLADFAPRCLQKRAKQVRRLAAEAMDGDAAARHRLRVAYKRLRYALEFFAPLFSGEALRQYHLAASELQEVLGRLNDLSVAVQLIDEALPDDQRGDLCCWLEQQSEALLPELGRMLDAFRQQVAPWKRTASAQLELSPIATSPSGASPLAA